MRTSGHKFRGPTRAVAVPIVWTVLGIVLAIATESPTYGILMTVFFGAFFMPANDPVACLMHAADPFRRQECVWLR